MAVPHGFSLKATYQITNTDLQVLATLRGSLGATRTHASAHDENGSHNLRKCIEFHGCFFVSFPYSNMKPISRREDIILRMEYRRFGRTEIRMPVYSCGGMRYQHSWVDCPLSEVPPNNQANLEATIHRSLELGINHIETARGYGSSERQLGVLLPTLPRDELIVQTKIAPCADPAEFRQQFLDSLSRLRLEYVDLLGLHGINTHEHLYWSTRPGGCLSVARELVQEGKIRHVGFSTHAELDVIQAAIAHDRDGGFDYVNLHWYYIFQRNWPAIEAATAADMGVFIISPADKGGMLYAPTEKLSNLCSPLHPLVMNCLFCLDRPEVHTLSLGASCPGDFDLQVSALEQLPISSELLPNVVQRLDQALYGAVGGEMAHRYLEGLPLWHDTPGYLNIPIMLWLRQLVLAFDMHEYGKMRYNLLGRGGHWFGGLNAATFEEEELLKAVKDSPFSAQIPAWLRETHELLHATPEKRLSES